MKFTTAFIAILISFFVGMFVGIGSARVSGMFEPFYEAVHAVNQCEQNLPRNQHCVAKITAEVIGDE